MKVQRLGTGFERLTPAAGGLPLAVSRLSLAVLAAGFAVASLAGLRVPLRVQAGVYLVGMVAMNLPHGGYEHFANLRRRVAGVQARYLAAYLLGIGLFAALLFAAPVAGIALAIGVAMAKGGLGDVAATAALTGDEHLRTRPQRWLAAAARGGAVMVVPMVAWPSTFAAFAAIMVGIFDPGAAAMAGLPGDLGTRRTVLAAAYGAVVLAHLGLGYRRAAGTGSFRADAAETLLLVAYFAAVPVVLAVGLYFPLWYSARQVARERAVGEPGETPDAGGSPDDRAFDGLLAPLDGSDPGRVALGAWAVFAAGALATFGLAAGLWTAAPQPLGGAPLLPGLVAFWSVFVSVIALPHVVVGGLLDRGRGIWYVP